MPVDSSIYFQQQTPDILGSIQKGLSLGQMIRDRNRQRDLNDAYKAGGGDEEKTLSELASRGFGQEALAAKEQFQKVKALDQQHSVQKEENDRKRQTYEIGLISQEAGSILQQHSQEAYERGLANLSKSGIDISQMPKAYDPNLVRGYYDRAITASQRMSHEAEQKKIEAERQKNFASLGKTMNSGEALPIDKKEIVKHLSTKNANKISIKNQIDAVMSNWDNLSEDQQLAAGRQLLKTLNSTEGADAIGVEEANRLGGKLEFALGNFTNSNSVQFGRDLSGFKEQAKNVSKAIDRAVNSNQRTIDTHMGRPPGAQTVESEIIKVQAPNGKIYNVPRDKYGAAIAAGGKRVK